MNQTPSYAQGKNRSAFIPEVAVANNGTVGVTYYDYRNNDSGADLKTDYFIAFCHPSNGTGCSQTADWGGEERITDQSFDMLATMGGFAHFVGDYMGLTTDRNDFLTVFSMSTPTDRNNIFFMRVHPNGSE